jgi:hypothetical protein
VSTSPGFDASATLAELQKNWNQLRDVDRADKVHAIHKSGVSFQDLAKVLPSSASQLRNLDKVGRLNLDAVDRFLANRGKISTREFVRRYDAFNKKSKLEEKELLKKKRSLEAEKGVQLIEEWLNEEGVWPSPGAAIVHEAHRILAEAENDERLPSWPAPAENESVADVIERMRPLKSSNPDVGSHGWYADWLVRWSLILLPDGNVRHIALWAAEERLHQSTPVRFF